MKSAVTVSLVEEAVGGPFVFWHDLETACQTAQELGFDAIELFAPGPGYVDSEKLKRILHQHQLQLAAVGTGAGWVKHKLSLTAAEKSVREQAISFIQQMMDYGAQFKAPAIIGSMQGNITPDVPRELALNYLGEALQKLDEHAQKTGVRLIYEPLNRYETKFINRQKQGAEFLASINTKNVVLLADLFHMNIEEADIAQAIRDGGKYLGHVHFVDSNRQAAGFGHLDYTPIIKALQDIGYEGYLSAEALSHPNARIAAEQTINSYHKLLK